MSNKRVGWIDICKGCGIILVILGHIYSDNVLRIWIYSFHMPLFFFVSGYIKGKRKKVIGYKKRVISLLVPYIEFFLFQLIFYLLIEKAYHAFSMGPIWFLLALFGVECITENVLLHTNKIKFGIACFLIIHFVSEKIFPLAFVSRLLSILSCGCVFYLLGEEIGNNLNMELDKFNIFKKTMTKVAALICMLSLSAFFSIMNQNVDMYYGNYNNIILYYLAAFAGIASIVILSLLVCKNSLLEYIGRNTMFIMGTHKQILLIVIWGISKILKVDAIILRNNLLGGYTSNYYYWGGSYYN